MNLFDNMFFFSDFYLTDFNKKKWDASGTIHKAMFHMNSIWKIVLTLGLNLADNPPKKRD